MTFGWPHWGWGGIKELVEWPLVLPQGSQRKAQHDFEKLRQLVGLQCDDAHKPSSQCFPGLPITMIFSVNIKPLLTWNEDLTLLVVQLGEVLGLGVAQWPGQSCLVGLLGFEVA